MSGRQSARQEALTAYLATIGGVVVLSVFGALAVIFAPEGKAEKVLAAMAFISAGVTGLVGVAGAFRPRGRNEADTAMAETAEGEM